MSGRAGGRVGGWKVGREVRCVRSTDDFRCVAVGVVVVWEAWCRVGARGEKWRAGIGAVCLRVTSSMITSTGTRVNLVEPLTSGLGGSCFSFSNSAAVRGWLCLFFFFLSRGVGFVKK